MISIRVAPNDELLPVVMSGDNVKSEAMPNLEPTPVALEVVEKNETILEVQDGIVCPSPQVALKTLPVHKRKKRSSILSSNSHKHDNRKKSKAKLKKVHFLLPKVAAAKEVSFWKPYDPKFPLIRRWMIVMLLPLSYEIWAFPYRLALGFPSIRSRICLADLLCDGFFVADIFFALSTLIPSKLGQQDAITKFSDLGLHYLTKTFPLELLPSIVYWVATIICVSYLHGICPEDHDPRPDDLDSLADTDVVAIGAGGGAAPIDGGNSTSVKYLYWRCVVQHQGWPLWVWWALTVPRFVPRFNRLMAYFKSMESDLVTLHACLACCPTQGRPLVTCLWPREQEVSVRQLKGFKFTLIIFLASHWVSLPSGGLKTLFFY